MEASLEKKAAVTERTYILQESGQPDESRPGEQGLPGKDVGDNASHSSLSSTTLNFVNSIIGSGIIGKLKFSPLK